MFVIHAAGGSETGIGHLSRCRSLAGELLRLNSRPVVLIYEAPSGIAENFSPSGAKLIIASSRASALEMRTRVLREMGSARSVLVTDLLDLDHNDAAFARRQGFKLLVHVNDSGLSAYVADLVIDGDAFKPTQQANKGATKYFCGAQYHIVDPSIACRRPARPWRKASVETVLVSFGGADPGQQTEFFVGEVLNSPSIANFTILAGPVFSPQRCDILASQAGGKFRFLHSCSNMADLILEHDAIVTLGGLTSYEAMCLGRAVFAVAWKHMAPYVEQLDEAGLLKNLGMLGMGDSMIDRLYGSLTDIERVCQLAQSGWQAIDGRGAERAANAILDECRETGAGGILAAQ
jgi:spore coat polysaccharide biosynthesis predicted glycosyltransferase SpsG